MTHAAVLLVLLPLLSAPIAVVLRRRQWVLPIVGLVAAGQLIMTMSVVRDVLLQGSISYYLGGWAPPVGIELRIDPVNALVLLLLALIFSIVLPYMFVSAADEIPADRQGHFYGLVLLCVAGLTGMTVTGDAFNVFVFLEISALSTYGLIALGSDRRALSASFRYLILGTTGSTFFLLGLGLLLMATGTLNMLDLAQKIDELGVNRTVLSAMAFIVVGLGLKLAMFPMHLWLPDAYAYAPSAITALVAATATKVSFYVLCRFVFSIFGLTFSFEYIGLDQLLLPLSIAGIFYGSLAAIYAEDLKKLLAWSSVAQLGYMVLGLSLWNLDAATGSLIHVFNHAVMKCAAFMAAGAFVYRAGSSRLADLRGMGRQMPLTSAAFVVAGLSLIGVPLTVGFVSKWYLVLGALAEQQYLVVVAVLTASLLALAYIWRVIEVLYFSTASENHDVDEVPSGMLVPMWIMAGLVVAFGVVTSTTSGMARLAATTLGF